MKKLVISTFAIGTVLFSCKSANTAGTSSARPGVFAKGAEAQAQRSEFLKLKGTWQITNVDYDKNFKVKPFDLGADAQCLVGSQWVLVPNNYTGSYTINGGSSCPNITQPFKFEVANGTEFKFKKIAEGTKAKANTVGYSLNLINQSAESFTLQQNIPSGADIVTVNYNFQKIK